MLMSHCSGKNLVTVHTRYFRNSKLETLEDTVNWSQLESATIIPNLPCAQITSYWRYPAGVYRDGRGRDVVVYWHNCQLDSRSRSTVTRCWEFRLTCICSLILRYHIMNLHWGQYLQAMAENKGRHFDQNTVFVKMLSTSCLFLCWHLKCNNNRRVNSFSQSFIDFVHMFISPLLSRSEWLQNDYNDLNEK